MAILETPRLELRRLTENDAPFVLCLLNEPSFIANIGDRGVRTLEGARDYIVQGPMASYERFGFGLYLVQLKGPAVPIGICGVLRRDTLPEPDIGFAFLPAFWSKGFAFESASAVKTYARDTLRLPRLLAIVSPGNAGSIRVLERLGFTFESTIPSPGGRDELLLFTAALD